MRIGVLLRQVPDPESPFAVDTSTARVVEESVPWVIDEGDEAALDAGLQLAAASNGEVVAMAVGPERAEQAARKALALGAKRALRLGGGETSPDPEVLAAVVAAAVRHESVDLLLAGAQTSASGAGLAATASARALGWPALWLVLEARVEAAAGAGSSVDVVLQVVQELEAGRRRRWRVRPPAVLAIQTGVYQARMPTIRGVLAARQSTIELLDPEELGLGPGSANPPLLERLQRVALDRPSPATGIEWIAGGSGGDSAGGVLVHRLRARGVL